VNSLDRSYRGGRRIDAFEHNPAIAIASHKKSIIVLQPRVGAGLLRQRHPPLLIDEALPGTAS
jgi:hypothetical protein